MKNNINASDPHRGKDTNISDEISSGVENLAKKYAGQPLLITKPANEWIKMAEKEPDPKMIFGELFWQNEICILFADTNVGKTILAVQIADAITKGEDVLGLKNETEKQKVLYLDFELSRKQFQKRYSNEYKSSYEFDSRFLRTEWNHNADIPLDDFEKAIFEFMEQEIIKSEARIIIVDNITYLSSGTERAKYAIQMLRVLKQLRGKHNLTILALAHTPKRDGTRVLKITDLSGSAMIGNFIDSSFAIGTSVKDSKLRYIKQVKQRMGEQRYGTDNVILCEIKNESNFTKFNYLDFGSEREHLKERTSEDKESIVNKAKELSKQGRTQREIAKELGISLGTVNNYIKE